jgi:hypothetical protein
MWCSIRSTPDAALAAAGAAGLVDLLCAAALGVAWLMWDQGSQMPSTATLTAQLKLPLGPFVWVMSVLCAVTAWCTCC